MGEIKETYDIIVAAEVVYDERYVPWGISSQAAHDDSFAPPSVLRLFEPLIETIVALSGFNTILLLAHTERRHNEGKSATSHVIK